MSDLVKFHELERAELEDVTALQTLTLEYLQRVIGSVIGADGTELSQSAGGVITLPSYTEDTGANTITLTTFSFVEVFRGGAVQGPNYDSSNVEARIGRYDSGAAWAGPIDVSAVTIVSPSSLWARTVRQSGDAQARRKWDTALSAEVPVTLDTRELEQVELAVSAANPAPAQGVVDPNGLEVGQWVRIGELSRVIGTPTIRVKWLSIWDTDRAWLLSPAPHAGSDEAQIALNAKSGLSEYADAGIEAASGFTRGFSLRDHLKLIRGQLQRVINQGSGDTTSDNTKHWLSAPLVSLRNVAARLGAVETGLSDEVTNRLQGDQDTLSAIDARLRVIAYFTIHYTRLSAPDGFGRDISLTATSGTGIDDVVIYPLASQTTQQSSLSLIGILFTPSLANKSIFHMSAQVDLNGIDSSVGIWSGLSVLNNELTPSSSSITATAQPYMRNDGTGTMYGSDVPGPIGGFTISPGQRVRTKIDLFSSLAASPTVQHSNASIFAPNSPAGWGADNQSFSINIAVWGA